MGSLAGADCDGVLYAWVPVGDEKRAEPRPVRHASEQLRHGLVETAIWRGTHEWRGSIPTSAQARHLPYCSTDTARGDRDRGPGRRTGRRDDLSGGWARSSEPRTRLGALPGPDPGGVPADLRHDSHHQLGLEQRLGGAHLRGDHVGHVPPDRSVRRHSFDARGTSHCFTGSVSVATNGDHDAVPRSGGWVAAAEPPDLAGGGGALPGRNQ